MKLKTIYKVVLAYTGSDKITRNIVTELKPSDFHLIKTMLRDGDKIVGLTKEKISASRYAAIFGETH